MRYEICLDTDILPNIFLSVHQNKTIYSVKIFPLKTKEINAADKLMMDRDEMTVVLFVCTDTIKPHDITTEADRPIQHSNQLHEHAGSDFQKKGSQRSTAVCLGVLCALLLLAIILLCVNLTKETNLLQIERDKLNNKLSEQDQRSYNPKWITHNHSSYYISSEWKTWSESRRDCRERGADLAIINNREEQTFLTQVTSANIVWIGLMNSDEEGLWKWVDGTNMTFGFWEPGEPNNKLSNEYCAVSLFNWADYPCNYTFVWICERGLKV
ncbi:putative C-type lectin domain family 4 member K-like [Triplophysa rosa]|uniref:C-type lectin domain family 4 member K-like n=1 Tax=Triplophysa rosa TaxID=992332 RepID=A0A9W7T9G6_TRIRA|nr:putative C-type lectin domain family 4 member K-like [Triplophysa rosa]